MLAQRIKCVGVESGCLGMIKECLGASSMRLGVPFIAPRQIGAVGGNLGRPILPSVGWRTGQFGVPSDNYCSCPVRDFLPFLAQPTVATSGWLAHRTLSSTYRTVRCPQTTVGSVAELPELFQLKCLSPAVKARPYLNGNNPSIPRI